MRLPYSSTYFLHHNHPKSCAIICTLPPQKNTHTFVWITVLFQELLPFQPHPGFQLHPTWYPVGRWRPPPALAPAANWPEIPQQDPGRIRNPRCVPGCSSPSPKDARCDCHLGRAYKPVTIKVHCWFTLRINQIYLGFVKELGFEVSPDMKAV